MTAFPPVYELLYAVSDLHMGGRLQDDRNFQVFNRGARLARFIRTIAGERPDANIVLVVNGDVFDSLAEDDLGGYIALDTNRALAMMNRLYDDPSFKPVWEALAAFVQTPRRHLVLVVGNHDIEMALPPVEHSLRHRLAGDDPEASSRITVSAHGGGFACHVGRARVFCTHGNEVDAWNWVDYSALGQLANALNAGRRIDGSRWRPNAGTRLVIDVMNAVKRRMPFIDLLKPEGAAVAGVLMALDRDLLRDLDWTSAFPVLRGHRAGRQVTENILGAYAADLHGPGASAPGAAPLDLLGPNLRAVTSTVPRTKEDDVLLSVERALTLDVQEPEPASDATETLGAWDLVAGGLGLVPRHEALRRALLDWLSGDRTFETHDPGDALFVAMRDRVADSVDFVLTGHTHLPRAMTYERGCHYFNSGTWIRTLRLTPEVLADPAVFEQRLWPALRAGRMDALDTATIPGARGKAVPLLFDRTNAVRITADATGVTGELLRVSDEGPEAIRVVREPGTEARRAR